MSEAIRAELLATAGALLSRMRTLHLATVDASGVPEASYAPYVLHDGAFFVYLSGLASHVANLRATTSAAILIVEDESGCEELFARRRLGARCRVSEEPRESALWHTVLDRFEKRFGETAGLVRPLGDFGLFRLEPLDARVVAGFARAGGLGRDELASLLAPGC